MKSKLYLMIDLEKVVNGRQVYVNERTSICHRKVEFLLLTSELAMKEKKVKGTNNIFSFIRSEQQKTVV